MNTTSLNLLAETILAAQTKDRTPMGIAFAIASAGQHLTPEITAELSRLRARVAELEAERHGTNESLSDAAEALRVGRDRIAGLEAERRTVAAARDAQVIAWLGKKAREYGTSNAEKRAKAEAVARMADKLSRGAVPVEDPHDSPLHHEYRLGHDLPDYQDCNRAIGHTDGYLTNCNRHVGHDGACSATADAATAPEVPSA